MWQCCCGPVPENETAQIAAGAPPARSGVVEDVPCTHPIGRTYRRPAVARCRRRASHNHEVLFPILVEIVAR